MGLKHLQSCENWFLCSFVCQFIHLCPFISVQLIHSSTDESNIIKLLMSDLAEVLSKMGDKPNVQKQLEYSFKYSHTESEIKRFPKCFTNDWPNDCLRAKAQKLYIFQHVTPKRASPFWTTGAAAANKPVSKLGPLFCPPKKTWGDKSKHVTTGPRQVQFSTQVASKQPRTCLTQGVTEESAMEGITASKQYAAIKELRFFPLHPKRCTSSCWTLWIAFSNVVKVQELTSKHWSRHMDFPPTSNPTSKACRFRR